MKTITTLQGKIMVDETADIKEQDYCDYPPFGIGQIKNIDDELCFVTIPIKSKGSLTQRLYQCKDECQKVIVTINHSISLDVPMVIVDNEIEKLALKIFPHTDEGSLEDCIDAAKRRIWSEGYKAAQQKGFYSESDLITYLEWVGEMGWYYEKDKKQWVHDDELGMFKSTKDLIDYYPIQSLNQEPIE